MNCRNFEKVLYLNKPGELDAREKKKLNKHLAECPVCKTLYEKTTNDKNLLFDLKKIKPQPENKKLLTSSIISNIEETEIKTRVSPDFIELFATWFYRPVVKYSFLLVLLIMTGSLLVQQIQTADSVSKLENLATNYSHVEKVNTPGLLNKVKQINSTNNRGNIYTYIKLFSLKKNIKRLGIVNRIAIYTELNNSPEFRDLFRSGNINNSDLQYLFESRDDILLKVNEIITKRRD